MGERMRSREDSGTRPAQTKNGWNQNSAMAARPNGWFTWKPIAVAIWGTNGKSWFCRVNR